jgi:hypothetical protein
MPGSNAVQAGVAVGVNKTLTSTVIAAVGRLETGVSPISGADGGEQAASRTNVASQ